MSLPNLIPLELFDQSRLISWIHHSAEHAPSRCVHTAIAGDDAHIIATQWANEAKAGTLICVATDTALLAAEHTPERAWIRGPLGDPAQHLSLWQVLYQALPPTITQIDAFPDAAATTTIATWQALSFQHLKTVHVMQIADIPSGEWVPAFTINHPDDEPMLAALHHANFAHTWGSAHDLLATHPHHHLALSRTQQGTINGYAWLRFDPLDQRVTLEYLAVDVSEQRQGIGRRLINHGFAWATQLDAQWVSLTVDADRTAAYALYQQQGFTTQATGVHLRFTID